MRTGSRWRRAGGVALVAAVALFVLAVFALLCVTDERDEDLIDAAGHRHGWRYELLVDGEARKYEPEFENEYLLALPEGTEAVRITRTMTEEIPRAELECRPSACGVEVALNGRRLYSDFQSDERGAGGFLRSVRGESEQILRAHEEGGGWRRVRLTLPADYLGGELSVTTYFPEGWENPQPEYPVLGSEDSAVAEIVVQSVLPVASTTVCAILALMLAGVFLMDLSNGRADGRTLMLCLFYALLFLDHAYATDAGTYSLLEKHIRLGFLSGLYVAPLYLYMALRLKKRWRVPLCAGVIAWTLYEGVRMFLNVYRGQNELVGRSGLGALALFLAVAAALSVEALARRRERSGARWIYALTAIAVALLCVLSRIRDWRKLSAYLVDGLLGSLRRGYFMPAVQLIADISSAMATIVLVTEFVRRTLRTRQEMSALQERGRQTMESYQRLLAAQDATNVLRHEMRHHMIALSGILGGGDAERAQRYVDAVAGDLDRLPVGRYSQNVLVDVIAGSFLDRAQNEGIRVEHRLNVPPELNIADEDLSVFLSNMLQNALEACERMAPDAERAIQVEMRLRGCFLFVKCVNSAPEEEPRERPGHGYGLAAMRRIAEKYDSVLLTDRAPGKFSVRSDLCLRRVGGEGQRS